MTRDNPDLMEKLRASLFRKRAENAARRNRDSSVAPNVLDEMYENSAWWEREYMALKRRLFPEPPFNPADHDGHNIVTWSTYGGTVYYSCTECPRSDGRDW